MTANWQQQFRSYQLENAKWLNELPGGTRARLLADGLGTGKTRSAYAALRTDLDTGNVQQPVMVGFTTASAVHDWRREAAKCWPELKFIRTGEKKVVTKWKSETPEQFERRKFDANEGAEWRQAIRNGVKDNISQPTLVMGDYWWAEQICEEILEGGLLLDRAVCDECFVPGTLVKTPSGLVPIEQLQVGDWVWAYEAVTGQFILNQVEATQVTYADALFELVFDGHVVKTTANHPFLTSQGWRRADELKIGDQVVRMVPEVCTQPKKPLLQQELLSQLAHTESSNRPCNVQGPGLQSSPCQRLGKEDTRIQGSIGHSQRPADETSQPDAIQGSTLQDGANPSRHEAQAFNPRGKRETTLESAHAPPGELGLARRSHHQDQRDDGAPEPHQVGPCECGDESGSRSRWVKPQQSQAARARYAEDPVSRIAGLVRLQSVQQRRIAKDLRGFAVHNLQVRCASTFLVSPAQLVVHNCHLLKSSGAGRSKAIRQVIARTTNTTMLTGTPVHNRAYDLHNLLTLCAPTQFPSSTFTWARSYFHIKLKDKNYPYIADLKDKGALIEDIKPWVWGRTAAELMGQDLPARTLQLKLIDVPGAVRMSPAKMRAKKSEEIDALLRETVKYKFAAAVELVRDADKPVVLYCYKREDATKLAGLLNREKIPTLLATGDSSNSARDKIIERWKMGEATALVCTMDAVRESATLTRADLMIFVDLHWLPVVLLQNMGRIDPARQPEHERRPVMYQFLVTRGGPDEVVAETIVDKLDASSGIGVKNQTGDRMADFLRPLDARPATLKALDPEAVMASCIERLNARADRLADLGML